MIGIEVLLDNLQLVRPKHLQLNTYLLTEIVQEYGMLTMKTMMDLYYLDNVTIFSPSILASDGPQKTKSREMLCARVAKLP